MPGTNLKTYLEQYAASEPEHGKAVSDILIALAECSKTVREHINQGALGSAFAGVKGTINADGDSQKELDVLADDNFLDAMRSAPIALYGSEELNNPVLLDKNQNYALTIDPLDGSSNIDTNVSIGTIFGILPVAGDPSVSPEQSFLQPGSAQLAAGFFIYGPQLALVVSVGKGTQIFVFSSRVDDFILAYKDLKIPLATKEYGINASNHQSWSAAQRQYIDDCLAGESGPRGKRFNMRWVGSMVADAYRILIRGGIFMYPADSRKGYGEGRLRLVYEANPAALLAEQAGGRAIACNDDGVRRILDIVPTELHQRIPLAFGSKEEVDTLEQYFTK